MEIKDLINEFNRMCDSITCEDCKFSHKDYDLCRLSVFDDTDIFVNLVTEWSNEYPVKTKKDVFSEKYPDKPWAEYEHEGGCLLGYSHCTNEIPCPHCEWWEEEYEEK